MEIGCKQLLGALQNRAYHLMADATWPGQKLIILIKNHLTSKRLYMKIWRYNKDAAWGAKPEFSYHQSPSYIVGLPAGMTHFACAHVLAGAQPLGNLAWQGAYGSCAVIPGEILGAGAAATTIDLNHFLKVCSFISAL